MTGREHETHRVVSDLGRDRHRCSDPLQRSDVVGVEQPGGSGDRARRASHDLVLLRTTRVVDGDAHEEPVALRLGQRVHALGLDRVLRREHEERRRHFVRHAADRHLTLAHDLEQRGLHLRGRPVDLVGEDEVREHRAELDVERLGRWTVDAGADDVGRDEVGRELDARERAAEDLRQRRHGQRLAETGNAFEEAMAAGEQADEHPLEHALLADDDAAKLDEHLLEASARLGERLGAQIKIVRVRHVTDLRVDVEGGHQIASTCSAIALTSASVTNESPVTLTKRSPSTHA